MDTLPIAGESNRISRYPDCSIDLQGNLHVIWEDQTNLSGVGIDWDIFYKMIPAFITPPDPPPEPHLDSPILLPITLIPGEKGQVNLTWSSVVGATTYHIFRDTSNISTAQGLTPIHTTSSLMYVDTLLSNGTYFYAIIAGNTTLNSSSSNCRSIEVLILPDPNPVNDIPGFGFPLLLWGVFGLLCIRTLRTRLNGQE